MESQFEDVSLPCIINLHYTAFALIWAISCITAVGIGLSSFSWPTAELYLLQNIF